MPAELPPTTSYTYAAEGEVRLGTSGTGAAIEQPVFNQDVFLYVRSDQFLTGTGFQDGDPIPYGSYDATRGAWSAEENGRFVAIDNNSEDCMPSFNPTDVDEEDRICMDSSFPAGTYMRIPVRHFSPLDLNWLLGIFGVLPRHAAEGAGPGASCRINNSIVYCEAQVLGESWDVAGSPFHLMYLSDRHPGRREAYRVRVRPRAEAGAEPSAIRVELIVAGRVVDVATPPGSISTSTWVELEWDGTDAYGRRLVGPQRAELRVGYTYAANYQALAIGDSGFGQPQGGVEADLGEGDDVTAWRREVLTVGTVDDRLSGLGGLGIAEHHFYDPATGTLIMGNGDRRAVDSVAATIDPAPFAATPFAASTTGISAITTGPDGTVYFFDQQTSRIRRRGRADSSVSDLPGTLQTYSLVSGLSVGRFTDSTGARLNVLWVADGNAHRVYRVDLATGARVTVLGSGTAGDTAVSAGSPVEVVSASSFPIRSPQDVVAAPDGSVYIGLLLSSGGRIVRYRERVGSTGAVRGFVEFVASADMYGAAGPASLALAPDGTLYYTTTTDTIRAVQPVGRTIAFGGGTGSGPRDDGAPVSTSQLGAIHGLAINPSGELCFVSRTVPGTLARVRCVRQDVDGPNEVFTVAGVRWVDDEMGAPSFEDPYQVWTELGCPVNDSNPAHCSSTGTPATRTRLAEPTRIAWSPDGRLYIVDAGPKEIRVLAPTLDGSLADTHVITSEDGSMFYEFNGAGQHTRTVDAFTGVTIHQFVYETAAGPTLGRLVRMYDVEGAYVDVVWDTSPARIRLVVNGLTTAIVLNAVGGYASRVCSANFIGGGTCHTAPASTAALPFWTLTYHSDTTNYPGLMTRLVGATGGVHDYCYDAGTTSGCPSAINNSGRLLADSNAGADVALLQDNTDPSWREVTIRRSRDPGTLTDAAIDTTYATRSAGAGLLERRVSHAGAITTSSTPADGRSVTIARWDGSVTERHLRPDPRPTHGLDAPYVSHATVSRGLPCPGSSCASGFSCVDGLCRADLESERAWSGSTLTDRVTVPSPPGAAGPTGTWTRTRGPSGAGSAIVITPPSGFTSRRTTALLDSRGRVTMVSSPGVYPICMTYPNSTATRPSVIWRGASVGGGTSCDTTSTTLRRRVAFTYDGFRYVNGVTEGPTSPTRIWSILHQRRGTVSSIYMVSAGGTDEIVPTFDGEGNLSNFRIGSTTYLHTIAWSDRNQPLTYLPPNTAFSGTGPEVTLTYRDGGSVSTRAFRGGRTETRTLDDATGFLTDVTRSDAVANDLEIARDVGGRPTWIDSAGGELDLTWDGAALRMIESSMTGVIGANGAYAPNVSPTGHLFRDGVCMGGACEYFTRTHDVDGLLLTTASSSTGATMGYSYSIGTSTTSVTDVATAGASTVTGFLDISALGELTSHQFIRSGSTVYNETICSRDTLGRVLLRGEIIRTGTTGTTTQIRQYRYTYDAHGYLASYERFAPPSGTICQAVNTTYRQVNQSWSYNHRGHRTDLTATTDDQVTLDTLGVTRTYNSLGQLTARGGRTFVHDVSGHLRSTTLTSTGATTSFDYDGLGRLVSIRPPGGVPSANIPAQRFIYRDQLNPIAWQRSTRNPGACSGGFDTAYFMYGIDQHTPELMVYDECSNGYMGSADVYRLLRDERGSVRLVVQITTGNVIQRVDYGAWGEPTAVLPSTSISAYVVQPFGFAGGIWMPEAQLWHFGARDMDPAIGRWTTKDPILFAGGYNLYLYANNDPVNRIDPTGHWVWVAAGIIGGGLLGGIFEANRGGSFWEGFGEGALIGGIASLSGVGLVALGADAALAGAAGGAIGGGLGALADGRNVPEACVAASGGALLGGVFTPAFGAFAAGSAGPEAAAIAGEAGGFVGDIYGATAQEIVGGLHDIFPESVPEWF